jgi:hypothetical protein
MKTLKEQLFRVLAGDLSTGRFETWLYAQDDLMEEVVRPGFMLDLVSLDYRSKFIYDELRSLVLSRYGKDEYLMGTTYWISRIIIRSNSLNEILNSIIKLNWIYGYDMEYGLFLQFYYLDDAFDLSMAGIVSSNKSNILEVKELASNIVWAFDNLIFQEQVDILYTGIVLNGDNPETIVEVDWDNFDFGTAHEVVPNSSREVSVKRKKWYEFWK